MTCRREEEKRLLPVGVEVGGMGREMTEILYFNPFHVACLVGTSSLSRHFYYLCRICGSHRDGYEEYHLMEYNVM
jgi:hypothetical protein